MGYASYHSARAQRELRHLLDAQWPNGMVPHIVFNTEALGGYFPEPDFWQCPQSRQTSGITMPPLQAEACLHLHRLAHDQSASRDFLAEMFPKLLACHRYFYRERDPQSEGLVYIRHPWESGRDNAPAWDAPMSAIDLDQVTVPDYERKDLDKGVDSDQRPDDRDYDRYVYLVDLFRRLGYDESAIYQECPFLVQDVGFNCILCRDNRALGEIAGILGRDRGQVDEWRQQTERGIREKLWSAKYDRFESFDLRAGHHLDSPTAMGFMPLYAGVVDDDRAAQLYGQMNSVSFCGVRQGNCFAIPDYDMTAEDYSEVNYWRGPVWLNINWMLAQGLSDYGYLFEAQSLRKDILELAVRFGFREYYDSQHGRGLGSKDFSWSAALFIDVLEGFYRLDDADSYLLGIPLRGRLGHTRLLNPEHRSGFEGPGNQAGEVMAVLAELAEAFYASHKSTLDYRAIAQSPQYARYLDAAAGLGGVDPFALGRGPEATAFWINLHNILLIQGVIDLGIENSVGEVPDFFDRVAYSLGGRDFSLNDIHHGILRGNQPPPGRHLPQFWPWDRRRRLAMPEPDPRVNFALCCGTRSCPKIDFYRPSDLDDHLDRSAAAYIASEVLVDPEERRVVLAEMFSWYEKDWDGREETLRFVAEHLSEGEHKRRLLGGLETWRVEYLPHDWHLNR